MGDLPRVYEVNDRIIEEIEKKTKDPKKRAFLLEILSYELEHLNEAGISFRYKEEFKKILNKASKQNEMG